MRYVSCRVSHSLHLTDYTHGAIPNTLPSVYSATWELDPNIWLPCVLSLWLITGDSVFLCQETYSLFASLSVSQ